MKITTGVTFDTIARKYIKFSHPQKTLNEGLYEAIGCDLVETYQLTKQVSVWFDEEFMFKQESWLEKYGVIHAIHLGPLQVLGNMVFLGAVDDIGNMLSLDLTAFDTVRKDFQYGTTTKVIPVPMP
jgi:hypothetical protein